MDASARILPMVFDFCSIVRATPGETLDLGLPGRTMVAHIVDLPLEDNDFGS
jgi:hypothetical protein